MATTKIQKNDLEYQEQGERLFHSQMWVEGSPLQFIIDSGRQKNHISAEFMKCLGLSNTKHPQLYSIRYPIPRIDDLLDQPKGAKYSSKIDLNSNYHHVPIEPYDVWKTAFKSKEDLFKWLVMPLGFTNALATFMRFMEDILRPFTNAFMVVYLEDNLVFSHTWEEHLHHIRQVLQTLQQHKLCANMEK
eukprot:PITA_24081